MRDETGGSGVVTHFYYNNQWQVAEERVGIATTADKQYIYHPNYVDAVAVRYWDEDNSANDVLETEHYYLQDANFNVTAVTDNAGTVKERYSYTPYGEVTILDADFSADADNKSDIDNEYLYTGRRRDPETGLQLNRNRFYHATMGRWVSRDPIGYRNGSNLYGYVNGMPTYYVDPLGLRKVIVTPDPAPVDPGKRGPGTYCPQCRRDKREQECCDAASKMEGITHAKCSGEDGPCKIKDTIPPGPCVSTLIISGHGSSKCFLLGSVGNSDKCKVCDPKDAEGAFGGSKDRFCRRCTIVIQSCSVGQNKALMDKIAAETGCTVRASRDRCYPRRDPFPPVPAHWPSFPSAGESIPTICLLIQKIPHKA